jgi:tRNA(Ile)-lysidine synthase
MGRDRAVILPSGDGAHGHRWGTDQLRLHRHLLRHPDLLPQGSSLLLAVSGGQDSMVLTTLLQDLQPLHHWRLHLWHGNHAWRPEAGRQAEELADWARKEQLPLVVDRAAQAPVGEAEARRWRYHCLARAASRLGCTLVLTGHTASDRAETVLLNLARGSHLRGVASLRGRRRLDVDEGEASDGVRAPLLLARPLLVFDRQDTARICRERDLPIWVDASNEDRRFARNRLRADVMPVLESLHPGAGRRISAQAQRLEQQLEAEAELLELALGALAAKGAEDQAGLQRRRLSSLEPANQRRLLEHWLRQQLGKGLPAHDLEMLVTRLGGGGEPGSIHLSGGWQLHWDRRTLWVVSPR